MIGRRIRKHWIWSNEERGRGNDQSRKRRSPAIGALKLQFLRKLWLTNIETVMKLHTEDWWCRPFSKFDHHNVTGQSENMSGEVRNYVKEWGIKSVLSMLPYLRRKTSQNKMIELICVARAGQPGPERDDRPRRYPGRHEDHPRQDWARDSGLFGQGTFIWVRITFFLRCLLNFPTCAILYVYILNFVLNN